MITEVDSSSQTLRVCIVLQNKYPEVRKIRWGPWLTRSKGVVDDKIEKRWGKAILSLNADQMIKGWL